MTGKSESTIPRSLFVLGFIFLFCLLILPYVWAQNTSTPNLPQNQASEKKENPPAQRTKIKKLVFSVEKPTTAVGDGTRSPSLVLVIRAYAEGDDKNPVLVVSYPYLPLKVGIPVLPPRMKFPLPTVRLKSWMGNYISGKKRF